MLTSATPPALYFRHIHNEQLIAVRGGLSDFYELADIEHFTGADSQDEAQRANAENWAEFGQWVRLEVPASGAPRLYELVQGDQVRYVTAEHAGPFRIPGCMPFTKSNDPDYFATLADLAQEVTSSGSGPQHRGVIAPRGELLICHAFEEEMGGSGELEWEPEDLTLGPLPQDSYRYTGEDQAAGVVTLWQEPGGAQRFFVETAPQHPAQDFPTLAEVGAEQLAALYRFRFVPYEPPTV